MMFLMVFSTGLKAHHLKTLDKWALDLLVEFSISYDRSEMHKSFITDQIERAKNARPSDEIMQELGYSVEDLL